MRTSAWGVWNLQAPIVLIMVGSGAVYARGVLALWSRGRRGRGVSTGRAACFLAGLIAVVGALISPLDHASGQLLSAHMGQHLLLVLVAAPLLVLGRPGLVALAALPPAWRRRVHAVFAHGAVRAGAASLTAPVVAWLVHVTVVWAWHAPGAYQAAVEHQAVHWLEHGSFVATAMLFWWVALEPGTSRHLARGGDVLYLVAAWVQSGALGAVFAFAAIPIYPAYAVQAARLGVDPLKDQQVAGLIMWIPAGLVYLGGACALFVSWLKGAERAARRAEAPAETAEVVRA